MAIYIDSANLNELETACQWVWIKGITTNPAILAKESLPVPEILKGLKRFGKDRIYYQLFGTTLDEMMREAELAAEILGKQLVIKIPPSALGFEALGYLSKQYNCCVTALYDLSQAVCAAESGAKEVVVYVGRAHKLLGDGLKLVREFSQELQGTDVTVLAASLKSPSDVAQALLAGADHVTVPFAVAEILCKHEFSDLAVAQFAEDGKGLFS